MFGLSQATAILVGKAISVVVIIAGLGFMWHAITSSYYKAGKFDTEEIYRQRDAEQRKHFEEEVARLVKEKEKIEFDHATTVDAIHVKYEQEKANANQTINSLNARIAAGLRLRDPGTRSPAKCGDSPTPPASPPVAVRDAATGAELSEQLTQFLTSEAARADAVVRQLIALQAEARALEKACRSTP